MTPLLLPERSLSTLDYVHHCSAEVLLNALASNSIDLIVTSPPYDNLRTYKGFAWNFELIARESYRVLKPGGVLVWVVGDATVNGSETLSSFRQAIYFREGAGFNLWDTMIWNKPSSPGIYGKRCEQAFEFMFVFAKGEPKSWNAPMERTTTAGTTRKKNNRRKNGMVYDGGVMTVKEFKVMQNVWRLQTDLPERRDEKHPAVFPKKLAERHILTWSNPGDVVLDYFMGSGTTAKMARKNGRHYIGCDIAAEYVELCHKRLDIPWTPMMPVMLTA